MRLSRAKYTFGMHGTGAFLLPMHQIKACFLRYFGENLLPAWPARRREIFVSKKLFKNSCLLFGTAIA